MLVKEIMTKNPKSLTPNTPITKVVEEMKRLDCGFIPITENGKIVGVVTDRDIALRAIPNGKNPATTPVREILTSQCYHVFEEDKINSAAEKMCQKQIRRLIVLDKNKRVSGVVSLGDIATRCEDHEIDSQIIEAVSKQKRFKKAA